MNIYMLLCQAVITIITLLIIFTAKPEKRYTRLLVCAVLIPICLFILHRNCFFNTVPHCNGCLIVDEGESKPPVDANDLKAYCFSAHFLLQIFLTAIIVKKNVEPGKRFFAVIVIVLIMCFLGAPIGFMQYM